MQELITSLIAVLSEIVIPAIFTLAFLVFLVNTARYFIIGGSNPEDQKKAQSLALWGIIGFVVILSFWGILSLFTKGTGLDGEQALTPDYMCSRGIGDCSEREYRNRDPGSIAVPAGPVWAEDPNFDTEQSPEYAPQNNYDIFSNPDGELVS